MIKLDEQGAFQIPTPQRWSHFQPPFLSQITFGKTHPNPKMSGRSVSFLALLSASAITYGSAFAVTSGSSRTSVALNAGNPVQSVFLSPESAKECIKVAGGSPLYAYSLEKLSQSADAVLAFPNAYGLTVRYAMKASPNGAILKFFNSKNIHIDASSGFEVRRAMDAGIPADHISLSTQELPEDFADLVSMGIKVNAW
jgi:diaminopimelate decarboxylase